MSLANWVMLAHPLHQPSLPASASLHFGLLVELAAKIFDQRCNAKDDNERQQQHVDAHAKAHS